MHPFTLSEENNKKGSLGRCGKNSKKEHFSRVARRLQKMEEIRSTRVENADRYIVKWGEGNMAACMCLTNKHGHYATSNIFTFLSIHIEHFSFDSTSQKRST